MSNLTVTVLTSPGFSKDPGMIGTSLRLDKPLVYPPNARAVLHYLEGGKLRVAGTLELP
jgi:hypothetical protein